MADILLEYQLRFAGLCVKMRSIQHKHKKGSGTTQNSYGQYIKTLHFFLDQIMNREMSDSGLTPSQGRIVGLLMMSETPVCARDVEQFFHLSHPTVSGLLSRMEAKGFIEMRPDESDRRIKRIYPLDKCYACNDRIRAVIVDNERQMVEGFTEQENAMFHSFLQRSIENLGRKVQAAPINERSHP